LAHQPEVEEAEVEAEAEAEAEAKAKAKAKAFHPGPSSGRYGVILARHGVERRMLPSTDRNFRALSTTTKLDAI
jgi:hypothetical protein